MSTMSGSQILEAIEARLQARGIQGPQADAMREAIKKRLIDRGLMSGPTLDVPPTPPEPARPMFERWRGVPKPQPADIGASSATSPGPQMAATLLGGRPTPPEPPSQPVYGSPSYQANRDLNLPMDPGQLAETMYNRRQGYVATRPNVVRPVGMPEGVPQPVTPQQMMQAPVAQDPVLASLQKQRGEQQKWAEERQQRIEESFEQTNPFPDNQLGAFGLAAKNAVIGGTEMAANQWVDLARVASGDVSLPELVTARFMGGQMPPPRTDLGNLAELTRAELPGVTASAFYQDPAEWQQQQQAMGYAAEKYPLTTEAGNFAAGMIPLAMSPEAVVGLGAAGAARGAVQPVAMRAADAMAPRIGYGLANAASRTATNVAAGSAFGATEATLAGRSPADIARATLMGGAFGVAESLPGIARDAYRQYQDQGLQPSRVRADRVDEAVGRSRIKQPAPPQAAVVSVVQDPAGGPPKYDVTIWDTNANGIVTDAANQRVSVVDIERNEVVGQGNFSGVYDPQTGNVTIQDHAANMNVVLNRQGQVVGRFPINPDAPVGGYDRRRYADDDHLLPSPPPGFRPGPAPESPAPVSPAPETPVAPVAPSPANITRDVLDGKPAPSVETFEERMQRLQQEADGGDIASGDDISPAVEEPQSQVGQPKPDDGLLDFAQPPGFSPVATIPQTAPVRSQLRPDVAPPGVRRRTGVGVVAPARPTPSDEAPESTDANRQAQSANYGEFKRRAIEFLRAQEQNAENAPTVNDLTGQLLDVAEFRQALQTAIGVLDGDQVAIAGLQTLRQRAAKDPNGWQAQQVAQVESLLQAANEFVSRPAEQTTQGQSQLESQANRVGDRQGVLAPKTPTVRESQDATAGDEKPNRYTEYMTGPGSGPWKIRELLAKPDAERHAIVDAAVADIASRIRTLRGEKPASVTAQEWERRALRGEKATEIARLRKNAAEWMNLRAKSLDSPDTPTTSTQTTIPKTDIPEFSPDLPKYGIYQTQVTGRGQMFAVRESTNPRGGGDTIHETLAKAQEYAKAIQARDEANAAYAEREQAVRQAQTAKDDAAKAEREDLDGFTDGMTPMNRARVVKLLNQSRSIDNQIDTTRNHIRRMVADGAELTEREEWKVKDPTRTQFNRMDAKEQEAFEERKQREGKHTVYRINGFDLGKTAYQYAKFLQDKATTTTEQPPTATQPSGETPAVEASAEPTATTPTPASEAESRPTEPVANASDANAPVQDGITDAGDPVSVAPRTPQATTTLGYANLRYGYRITTPSGAHVAGALRNADFPGQKAEASRGEIFFVSVPGSERRSGVATSLIQDAMRLIAANGGSTIKFVSPNKDYGQPFVEALQRRGIIGPTLQRSDNSGTIEVANPFFRKKAPANAAAKVPAEDSVGTASGLVPGQNVRIAGATFAYVRDNRDGTIVVKGDAGEFSTQPGEQWTPLANEPSTERVDVLSLTEDQFAAQQVADMQTARLARVAEVEAEIDAAFQNQGLKRQTGYSAAQTLASMERPRGVLKDLATKHRIAKANASMSLDDVERNARKVYRQIKQQREGVAATTPPAVPQATQGPKQVSFGPKVKDSIGSTKPTDVIPVLVNGERNGMYLVKDKYVSAWRLYVEDGTEDKSYPTAIPGGRDVKVKRPKYTELEYFQSLPEARAGAKEMVERDIDPRKPIEQQIVAPVSYTQSIKEIVPDRFDVQNTDKFVTDGRVLLVKEHLLPPARKLADAIPVRIVKNDIDKTTKPMQVDGATVQNRWETKIAANTIPAVPLGTVPALGYDIMLLDAGGKTVYQVNANLLDAVMRATGATQIRVASANPNDRDPGMVLWKGDVPVAMVAALTKRSYLDLSPAKVKQALARKADTATQPAVQQQAPASTPNVPTPTAASPKPTKVLNDNEDPPLPSKAIQHSITQIFKARDVIESRDINKKKFESALATIRTHASKLDIAVPGVRTYFYADEYRDAATAVTIEIVKRYGSFPTQERRDRRDAARASMAQPARQGLPEQAATPASPAPIEIRDRGTKAPAAVEQPRNAAVDVPPTDTQIGPMTLDQFLNEGHEIYKVTRDEWIAMNVAKRQAEGLPVESKPGITDDAMSDYEKVHADAVTKHVASGGEISYRVSQDYPDARPNETPARAAQIDRIVAMINEYEKQKQDTWVQATETKGSDGKWYRLDMPAGVRPTDERRVIGYVRRAKDGVTYGEVYPTLEAAKQADARLTDATLQQTRESLASLDNKRLESDEEFWLSESGRSKRTGGDTADAPLEGYNEVYVVGYSASTLDDGTPVNTYRLSKNGYTISKHSDGRFSLTGGATVMGHFDSLRDAMEMAQRAPDIGVWATQREQVEFDDGTTAVTHTLSNSMEVMEADGKYELRRRVGPGIQSLGTFDTLKEATDAAGGPPELRPTDTASKPYTLKEWDGEVDGIVNLEGTVAERLVKFERLLGSLQSLQTELNKLTIKQLSPMVGPMVRSGTSKAEMVEKAINRMLLAFNIRSGIQYDPFKEKYQAAVIRTVRNTTEQELQEHREAVQAARRKREEAIANPQTLADFNTLMLAKGSKALTPEQRRTYEALVAEADRKLDNARQTTRIEQVDTGDVTLSYKEGFHDKDKYTLHIVQLTGGRVPHETFANLKNAAKRLGGWWSSFRKDQSGFQFKTKEAADEFIKVNQQAITTKAADEARETDAQERASERLSEQAERMTESAEESLGQDRLSNTARRARMAAAAEQDARRDLAMAKTLENVAFAIREGIAPSLSGVRNAAQIRELNRVLMLAKRDYYESLDDAGRDRVRRDYNGDWTELPVTDEIIDKAKLRMPELHRSELQDLVTYGNQTPGLKRDAARVAKLLAARKGQESDRLVVSSDADILTLRNLATAAKRASGRFKYAGEYIHERVMQHQRLVEMGLKSDAALRTALREYKALRARPPEADKVREMERALVGRQVGKDFFPTPVDLAERMVSNASIEPGMRVLEPSAGNGRIADAIRAAGVEPHVVEMSPSLREILAAKNYTMVGNDFEEFTPSEKYDRIVMNPPFGTGTEGTDGLHVRRAYDMLAPGGRLVAVMSSGTFARSDAKAKAFRDWLESVGGTNEPLPTDTFSRDRTGMPTTDVNTQLVVIDKPGSPDDVSEAVAEPTQNDEATAEAAEYQRQQAEYNASAAEAQRLQQLGTSVVPGIRLQEAESAGRAWEAYQANEVTKSQWEDYVDDLYQSGKANGPTLASVKRGDIVFQKPDADHPLPRAGVVLEDSSDEWVKIADVTARMATRMAPLASLYKRANRHDPYAAQDFARDLLAGTLHASQPTAPTVAEATAPAPVADAVPAEQSAIPAQPTVVASADDPEVTRQTIVKALKGYSMSTEDREVLAKHIDLMNADIAEQSTMDGKVVAAIAMLEVATQAKSKTLNYQSEGHFVNPLASVLEALHPNVAAEALSMLELAGIKRHIQGALQGGTVQNKASNPTPANPEEEKRLLDERQREWASTIVPMKTLRSTFARAFGSEQLGTSNDSPLIGSPHVLMLKTALDAQSLQKMQTLERLHTTVADDVLANAWGQLANNGKKDAKILGVIPAPHENRVYAVLDHGDDLAYAEANIVQVVSSMTGATSFAIGRMGPRPVLLFRKDGAIVAVQSLFPTESLGLANTEYVRKAAKGELGSVAARTNVVAANEPVASVHPRDMVVEMTAVPSAAMSAEARKAQESEAKAATKRLRDLFASTETRMKYREDQLRFMPDVAVAIREAKANVKASTQPKRQKLEAEAEREVMRNVLRGDVEYQQLSATLDRLHAQEKKAFRQQIDIENDSKLASSAERSKNELATVPAIARYMRQLGTTKWWEAKKAADEFERMTDGAFAAKFPTAGQSRNWHIAALRKHADAPPKWAATFDPDKPGKGEVLPAGWKPGVPALSEITTNQAEEPPSIVMGIDRNALLDRAVKAGRAKLVLRAETNDERIRELVKGLEDNTWVRIGNTLRYGLPGDLGMFTRFAKLVREFGDDPHLVFSNGMWQWTSGSQTFRFGSLPGGSEGDRMYVDADALAQVKNGIVYVSSEPGLDPRGEFEAARRKEIDKKEKALVKKWKKQRPDYPSLSIADLQSLSRARGLSVDGGRRGMIERLHIDDDIVDLESALQRSFGPHIVVMRAEPVGDLEQELSSLLRRSGITPVFVSIDGDNGAVEGVYLGRGDTRVYLRSGMGEEVGRVALHEALHVLRTQKPKLYSDLVRAVGEQTIAKFATLYGRRLASTFGDDHPVVQQFDESADMQQDEGLADAVGSMAADPAVRDAIRRKPGLWTRIKAWVAAFLERMGMGNQGAGLRKAVLDLLRRMDEDEAPDPNAPRPDDLADQFALSKSKLIDDPEIQRKQAEADAALSKDMEEDRREYFGTKEGMWRMLSQMYATRNRLTQVVQEVRRHITHDGGVVEKNQFRYIISRNTYPGGKPWRVSQFVYRNGKWLPWGHVETAVLDDPATATDLYPRGAVQEVAKNIGTKHKGPLVSPSFSPSGKPVPSRKEVVAEAKALGLPGIGTTESIANRVRIIKADPSTWTRADFDAVKDSLAIHQDVRPGSDERVASIMRDGLRSGMVDSVGAMDRKAWTWAKQLMGGDVYVFASGTLEYIGDSAYLKPGNKPLFHYKAEKGQDLYEAMTGRRKGDSRNPQVDTPQFKSWFKDSKVVDGAGNPLIVKHGSPDVRGIFAEGFKARSRGNVWFAAADTDVADSYANERRAMDYQNAEPQTIPLYLSIQNPMVVDAQGKHWRDTERHVQEAKDAGHDGIIIKNSVDYYENKGRKAARPTTVYAWFAPSQAKSAVQGQLRSRIDGKPIEGATGNVGTFDPANPDIRFSVSGKVYRDTLGFERKAERLIQEKVKGAMQAADLRKMLLNNGVTADEMKWSGWDDALATDRKLTLPEILAIAAQSRVELSEVVKGGSNDDKRMAEATQRADAAQQTLKAAFNELVKEGTSDINETFVGKFKEVAWSSLRLLKALNGDDAARQIESTDRLAAFLRSESASFVSPYGPNGKTLRNRLVDALAKPRLVEAAREYITASQEQRRIRDETDESWMRNRTQFERYTLPGGTDYREVLLTLPKKAKSYQDFKAAGMSDAEAQRAANATFEQDYQSSHFPEPNIIAHMRLKDRTTPDGRRVLHIEEIQSDWHQAGRDRGYADPAVFAKLRAELEAADKEVADRFANKEAYAKSNPGMKPGEDDGTWDRLVEAHRRAIINRDRIKQDLRKPEQVPAAPFSKNWHEMAFRRVLRMAAEGGYDALAWTTGEQQAARFDLSKEVDAVHWQPSTSELWVDKRSGRETKQRKVADNVTAANLEQYVGRETARRILAAQEVDTYKSAYGDDLKVGGEGMREFYDRQLVRYADKYGKKWGAKVQDGQVLTKDRVPDPLMQQFTDDGVSYMTVRGTAIANPLADIQHGEPLEESEAVDYWVNLGVERAVAEDAITRFKRDQAEAERRVAERGEYEVDAHVLPITDAMRESVMGEGQVLFSIAGTPAQWADQAAAKAKVPAAEASMPVIADVEAARLVVADMVKSGTLKPTEAKAAAEKVLKGVDGARVQPASVLARRVAARLEKVANPTGNDVEQAFREVAFAHVTNAADVALRGARRAEADASVGTSRESRIREMERLQGLERSYRKAADEYKPESAKGKEESPDATRDRLLRRPAAPDRPVNVPAAAAVMKQSLLAAGLEVAVKAVAKKAAGKKVGRKSIYQFVDEAIGTRPVLRQQRDAVNRVARGFLRDVGALGKPNPADPAPGTPEYKTVMGERVEEAYRQAVSDLQTSAAARRQQADARAGAIREGMSPAEGMVSASDAAKASYRAQERLGRKMASTAARTVVAAMRQARQAARAEATAKVASLQRRWQRRFDRLKDKVWTARTDLTVEQQRTRARRRLEREIRRELTDVIRKYMPRTLRGDYITMVRDATNPGRLNDALVAIQHDLTFHNAKEATRMGLQTAKGKWVERIRGDKAAKAAYDAAVQTLMDAARRLKETNKVAKQPQPAKLTTMAGGTGSVGTATKRMSVDDLLALQDRVEQAHAELLFLRKDAAEKEQIRVEGKVLARETVVESVLKSLALRPDLARPLGLPAATRTSLLGRYHIANATPDTIAAMLRNPLARKLLVEELWRGETDAMADTYAATDEMKRLLAAAGFEWGSEKLHRLSYTSAGPDAQQMTLNLPDAGQVTASPGEWMAVLATLARESSGRKILEEGRPITFGRDTHMTPVTLTAADADAISDALDKMGLVSVVHGGMKFMSGTADALNKAYYSATGRYLKLEPLYFPTHVNRDQQPIENLIGAGPQYVRRALENLGFLQPTDERATSPYLIKDFFDEYNQYTHASAIMVHMTDRVRAMEAVFKDRRILAEIERKFGSDINERLDRMIEAGKLLFSEPKSRLDKVAVSLGRKIAKAELTLNPGTWMKQFGSVPKLYAVMDAEHIAAGIENMMDPVVTDLLKNDAYFRNRIEDAVYRRMSPSDYKRSPSLGQVNTADAIKRIMEGGVFVTERSRAAWGSATDRIEVMNWFDGISSRVAIGAALSMGRAKGLTGQALLRYAAWEAQMAIRRVNNTSSVLDMSGWAERNRGNWLSLSMLFTSDANKNYNLIAAAFEDQGGKVAGKKMGRAIVGIAASNLWGAMIGALIGTLTKYGLSALFDDDEAREALMGEVGSQFVRSNLGSLYFGDVIYDLTRAGYRVATKQPVQVNSVFETPVSSKVADATEGAIRFAKSFEAQGRYTSGRNRGEYRDEVMYREGLWQMAEAISGLMGNPLLPWMRYLRKYMQQE